MVYQHETEYYIRYDLLFEEAKVVVINELSKYYSTSNPSEFYKELNANKAKFRNLNNHQKDILFPSTKETLVKHIDISLGTLLIEKEYRNKSPPKESVQSDIICIKKARNELAHSGKSLTQKDFQKKWSNLQTILIRRGVDKARIREIRNMPLDERVEYLLDRVDHLKQKHRYVWHNVDKPSAHFHGREQTLDHVHKLLMENHVVVLTGYGGLGKTQLALKYAHLYGSADYCNSVVVIDANGPDKLENSFKRLADELCLDRNEPIGMAYRKIDIDMIINNIFHFFSGRRSLFIFDNVNNYDEVKGYLRHIPPNIQGPSLLLTSQYTKWDDNYKVLEVTLFTDAEASEFVLKYVIENKRNYPNCVKSLCENLQNLPLALDHAVSYIRNHAITVAEYNKELSKQRPNMKDLEETSEEHYYLYIVSKTWLIAFQKLEDQKNEKAIMLIRLLAFLDNKNISMDFLMTLGWTSTTLHNVLGTLSEYSLVNLNDRMISIHLLVQYAIRMDWMYSKQTMKVFWKKFLKFFNGGMDEEFGILMAMIHKCLTSSTNNSDDTWVPHVVNFFHLYKDSKSNKKALHQLLEFISPLNDAFQREGQYELSYNLFKEMFEIYDQYFDESEKAQLYNLRNCMAMSLQKLGNIDKALQMLVTLRDEYIKRLGDGHSSVVLMEINVASAMVDKGELRRAKELLTNLRSKVGFKDIDKIPRNTAEELRGNICLYMGSYRESLEIFCSLEEKLISNDVQFFNVMYNKANCHFYLGDYEIALRMFQDLLKFACEEYSDEHLYVFLAKRSIGKCKYRLGLHEEALVTLDETLDGIKNCFDENHFDYLSAHHYKILCLLDFDKRGTSLESVTSLAKVNLQKRLKIYGDNHQYVFLSQTAVASCLLKELQIEEALELLKAIETKQLAKQHDCHPDVLNTQYLIGKCYLSLNEDEMARMQFQAVLEKQTKTLGEFHPSTQQTKNTII